MWFSGFITESLTRVQAAIPEPPYWVDVALSMSAMAWWLSGMRPVWSTAVWMRR